MLDNLYLRYAATAGADFGQTPFSPLQWQAIGIGIREGEQTLVRSRQFGVLWLFLGAKTMPLANKTLEALRSYAELARVLIARRRSVPDTSLVEAGFSASQIDALNAVIAAREEAGSCAR